MSFLEQSIRLATFDLGEGEESLYLAPAELGRLIARVVLAENGDMERAGYVFKDQLEQLGLLREFVKERFAPYQAEVLLAESGCLTNEEMATHYQVSPASIEDMIAMELIAQEHIIKGAPKRRRLLPAPVAPAEVFAPWYMSERVIPIDRQAFIVGKVPLGVREKERSFSYGLSQDVEPGQEGENESLLFYPATLKELLEEFKGETADEAIPTYIVKDIPHGLFFPTMKREKWLKEHLRMVYSEMRSQVERHEIYPNFL